MAAYVLAGGFAQALAIVPGTGISIWPPGGLFMATLILAPRRSWPWWMLAGLPAELFSNALWFHSPLPAAVLMYVGNALEAAIGAWLVNWACGRPVRLETLQEVLAFVVLGAGIAPIVSATVGSATLAWFGIQSQTFAAAWPLWWIGDATGVLIVAPLALVVFQNWHGKARLSAAQWVEACVLGLIFLGVAALSLSGYLPFAYIIMPPLLWAAVRFDFKGAAASLILLALITAVFTTTGASQFVGDPESQRHKQVMLQLFLAISAFSALIVAAISRQHQLAMLTLRQSVEALRERERELSQLVDMVPSHVWRLTPDGEPTYFNKRMVDFLGLDIADTDRPGMSGLGVVIETVHPEDAAMFGDALRRCLVTGESFAMRYRLRRADGVYRWMSSRAEPMRNEEGRIVQWYGLCHDIDDQMHAEEALRQSERRYRELFHYMPIGLTQVDAGKLVPLFKELRVQGVRELRSYIDEHPEFLPRALEALEVEEVNQHIVQMFGAKNAEEMRGPIARYWQPGLSTIRRSIEARYRGEEVFREETRVARVDGSVIDVLFTTARPGAVADKSLVGFIDITERKKAEGALRNREREFSQLVNMVPSLIWRLSPDGEPIFFNKRMIDFLGLDVADADRADTSRLLAVIGTVVHPDDAAGVAEALNRSITTGESFAMRYRLRRADGMYRWMSGRAEPMRNEEGQIVQWYGLSHDIDDQMHAEEALRERERFLWQLVETLPALIDCAAPNGEPVYRSQQLREFLGYELEALDSTGKSRLDGTLDAGVHPDDIAGVKKQYAHSLSTGEPYACRHRLRRADGEYRWVETRAAPMRNAAGAIVQWNVICLDIDGEVQAQEELRLAQDRLARASQAASLAELSASIAHEVNQPLAAVVANSHACQRWLTADPPNIERANRTVERIIRDANSAADVVSRIRALFRQSVEARNSTAFDGVVVEARDLLADEAARRRIRINVEVETDLPPAKLDRVQIQQVLINLIRNGMDAMDSVAADRILGVQVRRKGDVIQTEVSDRGSGLEFPDRIFEPFFTTKDHGMGMGLAICRSIVESHGGRLWAERNEPSGANFIFTLPVETKASA